jgi:hypothetical protein
MNNFTSIRNGLREHIAAGKLGPYDLGIYCFLHLSADWATGIYHGCALTIAFQFGDPRQKTCIQQSIRRLRDRGYINFRRGDGARGAYPILINKYEPTVGKLSGTRLNAWQHGELVQPEYEPQNGEATVLQRWSDRDTTVKQPIQDLKTLQDVQDVEDKAKARKRTAPFDPPTLQQVANYCQERHNAVDPQHWLDYYTSNGWRVGRNPMKDWKAAVRTWEQNGVNHASGNLNGDGKPSVGQIVEREVAILHARRAQ